MKLYHVEPSAYGTRGAIVIADTEERAKELYVNAYGRKYNLSVTLLIDRFDQEYISEEFLE